MACYHPIPASQDKPGGEVRLNPPLGTAHLAIPCGGCIGCRAARATQWARRCAHEAKLWDHNTFITLTYDEEHLPNAGHLEPDALQRFFKRLRRHRERHRGSLAGDPRRSIRYFACGEYGEKNQRPHYHAILFNVGFPDRLRVGGTSSEPLYESETLASLWTDGQARLGDATPAAANYIAQYSLKKQYQPDDPQWGRHRVRLIDPETGEDLGIRTRYKKQPPFLRMSLKPAIGYTWLDKFKEDLRNGYLIHDGQKTGIPRSYIQKLKSSEDMLDDQIRTEIEYYKSLTPQGDRNKPDRLRAEEIIHKRRKQKNEKQL